MGARSSSSKNWRWAVTRRTWFNYPHARAHSGWKVSWHGTESTCIVSLSVIRQGQRDSGESCIMLQSGLNRSLDAKFPQRSVVACSTRISCCRGRALRTSPRTRVCEPLMSWRPKCIRTIAAMWAQRWAGRLHGNSKEEKSQNWGVGACSGQYGMLKILTALSL